MSQLKLMKKKTYEKSHNIYTHDVSTDPPLILKRVCELGSHDQNTPKQLLPKHFKSHFKNTPKYFTFDIKHNYRVLEDKEVISLGLNIKD